MPIRMVDDPENEREDNNSNDDRNYNPGGGGGGFGGFGNIIMMFLPMLIRNPKLLLIAAVIGVVVYFSGGLNGCGGGAVTNTNLSRGGQLSEEEYSKTDIFPALDNTKNPMPESVSLLQYCPKRLNQGAQGSCVAWSSAYAARTILQARATGKDPNSVAFSPSFLYNQVALEGCQGAYIPKAMEVMMRTGAVGFNDFPYDPDDCSRRPGGDLIQKAEGYKIRGYQRLSQGDDYTVDFLAIKQNLAKGAPVLIGMMVGGTFMEGMMGREVWQATRSDKEMRGFGGHAICVIGYDDNKSGGAFQIMNSWGSEWGNNGVGWVTYPDFQYFVKEAYGLYPMGNAADTQNRMFSVKFGLVDAASKNEIPLASRGGNLFATASPMNKNQRFKVQVSNSIECYTYIFGQETDGSSYVLFPYTAKHSPYCGITGTRIFPRDQSLMPDDVGTQDFMAVVVTKTPIDYNVLNNKINASKQSTYQAKLAEALAGQTVDNVRFNPGNVISFDADPKGKNVVAAVIAVDKK